MDQQRPAQPARILNRRDFLSRVAATAGTGALGLTVPPFKFEQSLLATPAKTLNPIFVAGTLVAVDRTQIQIHVSGGYQPEYIAVGIAADSDICRHGCGSPPQALRIGDRVEVGTRTIEGARQATWINANPLYGWGVVKSVTPQRIVLQPKRAMPEMGYTERVLLIEPYSRTFAPHETFGSASGLVSGDVIFYTATADTPNELAQTAWAYAVYRAVHK